MLVTFLGLVGVVLSISFVISIVPVFTLAVALKGDFNRIFIVFGLPMASVLASFWFWRNFALVRNIVKGE